MKALKIAIVEDDPTVVRSIAAMLSGSGYLLAGPASHCADAIGLIEAEVPDLLLIDHGLMTRMSGERAVKIALGLPCVVLTAGAGFFAAVRMDVLLPMAQLPKPFTRPQLHVAIETAATRWNQRRSALPADGPPPAELAVKEDFLFVKEGHHFHRVDCCDIVYAESEQNYIKLFLGGGVSAVLRNTMAEFELRMEGCGLQRVHRSYIVRLSKVQQVLPREVVVDGATVPMSRSYRDAVVRALGIGKF